MGPNSAVESVEFGSQLISAVCGDFKLVPSEFRSNADVAYIATLRFRIMFRLRLRLRIMFRLRLSIMFRLRLRIMFRLRLRIMFRLRLRIMFRLRLRTITGNKQCWMSTLRNIYL